MKLKLEVTLLGAIGGLWTCFIGNYMYVCKYMYKEIKVGVFLAFHDSRFISAYILLKLPRRIDHIAAAWSRADSTREIVVI